MGCHVVYYLLKQIKMILPEIVDNSIEHEIGQFELGLTY